MTESTRTRERQLLALAPLDNRALANLCGPLDANLRQIEAALDVTIAHRGGTFTLGGKPAQTARAAQGARTLLRARREAAVGRRHPAWVDRDIGAAGFGCCGGGT
jgi:phosphate starvation-inducible protein PhoH